MPELPEVETIRRGLNRLITGKMIARARHCDSPKSFPNDPTAVAHFLHNARVIAVLQKYELYLFVNACLPE